MTVRLTALSVMAAAVVGGGLAVQMAAGSDPALGPKQKLAARKALAHRSDPLAQSTAVTPSEPPVSSAPVDPVPSESAPSEVAPSEVAPAPVTQAPVTQAPAPVVSSTS